MNHENGPTQLEPPTTPVRVRIEGDLPSPRRIAWVAHLVALFIGMLGMVCAAALPFAEVWTNQTEVRWPAANTQATSTTAFFAPYRPASFTASVPCSTLRTALAKPGRTTVFSTLPPGSDREGMVLTTQRGEPELLLGQREVPLPTLPVDCELVVRADSHGSVVSLGDRPPITLPGIAAPEIFTFSTDLPPGQVNGVSVTARTFSWFDTSPTAFKHTLITTALFLAAVSLMLLLVHAAPSFAAIRRALSGLLTLKSLLLLLIDAAVAFALATWLVIGPITDDDGFAMMTVRNYEQSGDIGNYYRWFNASETPFTLLQHLMRWVSEYSLAPAFLRVPSVVAGLLTWLVVSRGIVAPLCGRTRLVPVHLVTAVFFLACWMPYCVGIRPEAFIALGASLVVATLLKATREGEQAPFFWLGAAVLSTALTVAVTPTGVTVLLTVLVFLPRIARLINRRGVAPRWLSVPTRLALVGCVSGAGLVAMFADSTWNGVHQATAIHDEFGPSLGWYQEIGRYTALLGTNSWGASGKRMAVFLVLTALLVTAACVTRQTHRWTRMPEVPLLLGSVLGLFAALWLTPSKWSHHFGALAGIGAALLAVTVVLLTRAGSTARGEARLLGIASGLGASVAAALSFMGPNAWWQYSDIAMPWSDTPVRPAGLPLDNPLLWIAVGVATGVLAYGAIRLGRVLHVRRLTSGEPGSIWTLMPASVLSAGALASVGVLLGTFLAAPQQMGDRFTVARSNWQSVTATSCGMEDEVDTLPLARRGTLTPAGGTAELEGFSQGAGLPQEPALAWDPEGGALHTAGARPEPITATPFGWNSVTGGPQTTGSLTTPWFTLPKVTSEQVIAVWVSGRPEQGNSLTMEFGTSDGRDVRSVATRELKDPPPTELPFDDPRQGRPIDWRDFRPWRLMTVEARDVPADANRIRLHAEDRTADEQGWLALSGPVVRDVVPLRKVLDGQEPTLIDWPISFLFPCRFGYPRVSHGTADSPNVLVAAPDGEGSMSMDPKYGGVFAGVPSTSRRLETPSRLRDAPGVRWGHVYSVSYDVGRDAYDTSNRWIRTGGADGDGEYPFEEH